MSDEALESLQDRLRAARVAGPHGMDPFLQLEVLLYLAHEVHMMRDIIDAIDLTRSDWP